MWSGLLPLRAGSTSLVSHQHWHGIPDGWAVLSGYCPRHAAGAPLPSRFSPLDPGTEVGISLTGGLAIRATVYAEGTPPRIAIAPLPDGASVSIGGRPAKKVADGAWETDGWDSPGHHLIDVVPGPSLTYQIISRSCDEWGMAVLGCTSCTLRLGYTQAVESRRHLWSRSAGS